MTTLTTETTTAEAVTLDSVFAQAQRLSPADRLRLIERITVKLHGDILPRSTWHAQVLSFYGALADDPIERPSQPPYEEREPLE